MRYKVVTTKNIVNLSSSFQESKQREQGIPRMGLLYAPTGFGKTTASAWLVNRENGIYVRAGSLWSPTTMVMAILDELSIRPPRFAAQGIQAIVAQMKLSQRPLFIDEADYLFYEPRMIDAARDIHDLAELPVWFIGSHKLEKRIAQRKIVAGRISQWVKFLPCDFEDTQRLAKELCLVEVQVDLLEQLHKAAKGSIRSITVGLSRIEAIARLQRWKTINAQQWGANHFFFDRQVDYQDE
ncbi:MAG: ATP-binding protein [Aphanocapsa sp. GSE-SYN-MK-11-07L]|jgi:DNA transposition AAA+ family ATPase|nr:ATP-binding protein [Aphanocapsa sp. GSE-SYN-MK-11-07L]